MNSQFSGVSSAIRPFRKGAANMAKRSGASLAILLGEISPKSSTRAVITTVDIVTPFLPKYEVKITTDSKLL